MDPNRTIKTTTSGRRAAAARDGRLERGQEPTRPLMLSSDGQQPPPAAAGMSLVPLRPVPEGSFHIRAGDRFIGEIRTFADDRAGARCHAIVDLRLVLPRGQDLAAGSLAQGHGETPEAALADAISRGRRFVAEYAAALEKAAALVGIDPPLGA